MRNVNTNSPYNAMVAGILSLNLQRNKRKAKGRIKYEYVTIKYKSFSKFGFEPKVEKL